jgi:hypothetical protein
MTRHDGLLGVSELGIFMGFIGHHPAREREAASLEQNPAYGGGLSPLAYSTRTLPERIHI